MVKSVVLIMVIGFAIVFSGCTGGQDVTSVVKSLPEVQQFMNEHPNAKITVTYWSKEEIMQSLQEISLQCDKSITPVAMYKAIVSEGNLKIISWINAENQIVICSITQGSGGSQTSTPIQTTPTQTSVSTKAPTASIVASNNPDTEVSDIKISHKGGDTLKSGEWKVSLVAVGQPPLFKVLNRDFSVGEVIIPTTTTCDFRDCSALSPGGKYDLKIVHIPSNSMLLDTIVEVRSSVSTKAPTASIVAANNPDSPGVDIKISHKGGDLLKAGEWKVSVVLASNPIPVYVTATSTSGEFGVGSQIKVTSLTTGCTEPVDSACIITNSLLTTDGAALVSGTRYDVKMVHIPSNAMIVDTVLEVR